MIKRNKSSLKTAIYSGSIPSATFVENLIKGVAKTHQVLLFGVSKNAISYNKHIKIYATPKSHVINLLISIYRTCYLLIKSPKRFFIIIKEIKNHQSFYLKWIHYTRLLPVVLYLPDVFHVQWAKDLDKWKFLKEKLGVKIVLSLRGAHINYSPIADEKLAESYRVNFPKVDAFHAVSDAIALEAEKYGATTAKTSVIHSPISNALFALFKANKTPDSNPIKILSIGRFHWKKGYKYAIDALKLLRDQGLEVHYTIISSNEIDESLLFQMHQLDLVEQIQIMKGLDQKALFKTMQGFDVLLLPSLEEGIANVVLEAMALGIPVISTDCGGMAEVVFPNKTGWLVSVRNPEAMAKAVIEFANTPEFELQRITQNAHDFVLEHFNAEDSITQFLKLYESVIDKNYCHSDSKPT